MTQKSDTPHTPDTLLASLAQNDIPGTTYDHPPVHTVAESQALRGDIPGAHTKNLFLRDGKKTYFLLTLAEDTPVNLKALRGPLGAKGSLSFASPEALMEHLGILPGSVSLLALANDTEGRVRFAIDAALMRADLVGCHPLTNARTTVLTPDALRAFFRLTGHEAMEVEIPTAEEA
ncbi:prolyl-tRNA synthetase associated domain-containing protein [Xanthobacter wiegelii]|uniref:prolyl-tRNA synthetase associated domain-containing protein n=1 Tax=Xanthobacter wiegelii TaxID=3119913 RepID=UPI0037288D11